jgi:glycosyltransferase involved in cell wall biosynthesis
MRVLHVVTQPWHATEGIARACTEISHALDGVESHVVTDGPWYRFGGAVRQFDPDVVHLHGGVLALSLAYAPSLRDRAIVTTCYAFADRGRGSGIRLQGREPNVSLTRALATKIGGIKVARRALRTGRVGALVTADARVATTFGSAGPVVMARGAACVSEHKATWSSEPTVVFAGRAQSTRGLDDLLTAFPLVLRSVPRARLRLALLPSTEAEGYAARLRATPWVDVTTGVTDLSETFAECQVGAFPFRTSTTITPALTAAEAMAAGLPIVATAVDCLAPLVIPGRNGALVTPRNPAALATAIAEVLRGPETWQPLSEGARKTIEEDWSWPAAAAEVQRAYEIAIARCSE